MRWNAVSDQIFLTRKAINRINPMTKRTICEEKANFVIPNPNPLGFSILITIRAKIFPFMCFEMLAYMLWSTSSEANSLHWQWRKFVLNHFSIWHYRNSNLVMTVVIGGRILKHVLHSIPANSVYLWSDNQIVLHWLPTIQKLKTFIQNSHRDTRNYSVQEEEVLPTDQNPPDLLTRDWSAKKYQKQFME